MELYKSTEFHAKGQILQALTGISKESTIFLYISWEIQIQLYSLGYLVTRNRRKIEGEQQLTLIGYVAKTSLSEIIPHLAAQDGLAIRAITKNVLSSDFELLIVFSELIPKKHALFSKYFHELQSSYLLFHLEGDWKIIDSEIHLNLKYISDSFHYFYQMIYSTDRKQKEEINPTIIFTVFALVGGFSIIFFENSSDTFQSNYNIISYPNYYDLCILRNSQETLI